MTKLTGNRVKALWLLAVAVSAGGALAPIGCSSGPTGAGVDLPDPPDIGENKAPAPSAACKFPSQGCACEDGQFAECGEVLSREGTAVTCAIGNRKCDGKQWGTCSRENVVTRQVPPMGSEYSTMGFGAPSQCANNPCDPYCYNIIDNGTGIDAGSPIKISDGGVTLDGKPKPPDPVYTGIQVTPNANPSMIIVTGIPAGQYPITNPPNPIQFAAEYKPVTNPPSYTPAIWSLDAYDYSLINGAGKLTVITAVPHRPLVKATASNFTATSQAEVIVDVVETAAGISQPIIDQLNQDAPPNPGPVPVTTTLWSDPFANNSKGWTLDVNPPPPPPDVPPPPPPDALLNVQTAKPNLQADDFKAAPYPGAMTAPQANADAVAPAQGLRQLPPPGIDLKNLPKTVGAAAKKHARVAEIPVPEHLEALPAPEPQGGSTRFQPMAPDSAGPLTPLEAARSPLGYSGMLGGTAAQLEERQQGGLDPLGAGRPELGGTLTGSPQNGAPPPPPPPCAGTYSAVKTFTDRLSTTTMTLAWDGTSYWSSSGGSPSGARYAKYDAAGNLLGTYAPGLDFRSVFTKEGSGSTVYGRQYANPTVYQQTSPGVFGGAITLSGGTLDAQAAVTYNTGSTEFNAFLAGTMYRWNTGGTYLGSVSFAGFGGVASENNYPQNRGIATAGGYFLTYANQVLSVWSAAGARLSQSTLVGAGTSFDSHFSLSYADSKVWIVDVAGGAWRGYDLSACLGGAANSCTHPLFSAPAEKTFVCPTGAKTWSYNGSLDPASSDQAKAACEACYGAGKCYLENADCAGLGWGPSPPGSYSCGNAYFGYQAGCSGDNGRTWPICQSWDYADYGYWGKPPGDSQCAAVPPPPGNGSCTHPLFSGAPVNFTCPTGAKSFSYTGNLDPASSDQAKAACEACYGAGKCYLENADCAGLGWGPSPPGQYACGNAYFGYQNGCSGDWGRSWPICYSWANQGYGHWGMPAAESVCQPGGGGACSATSVTFEIEEAACAGGTFDLWINGAVVKNVAPAVGCTCNLTPMKIVINDAASLSKITGAGDKFAITVNGGSQMAYGYAKVDVAFSNAAAVSVCLYDAIAGGNCVARELCNGLGWDVNPAGATPAAQCKGGAPGACKGASVEFEVEEAACGGGMLDFSINGAIVKSVAPAIGCTCNITPMTVLINDAASLSKLTGAGDKFGVALSGGTQLAYAYVKVTAKYSNGNPVTACLFDAVAGGNCVARELCNGYQWDVNPTGAAPAAQCSGGAGGCTHPLFSNGGGFACPTGATSFSFVGNLDPASSDQAKAACEACYGAGKCFLEFADCAGGGWGPAPPGAYTCGKSYFGYQAGCSGDNGRSWSICNSFTTYGWWGKPPAAAVCDGASEWQIGAPKASAGQSYGNPDPAADHGGNNGVAGVALGGNALQNPHGYAYLTSPAINTAGATTANLEFWRWLNSDAAAYMVNTVDAYNGAAWSNIWTSGTPGDADAAWNKQTYDVTAQKNAAFKFRFGFKVTSNAVAKVSGWNLDDVAVTNTVINPPPPMDTRILYPYAGTVFPRSFTPPVLQWDSPTGKAATYVKYCLRFNDPAWPSQANKQTFSWCYISAEPNPMRGSFPVRAWQLFETTASGKDAKLTLQRIYNGAQLPQVEVPIHFSSQPMRGSVYYWQINTGSVNRINQDGSLSQNFLATGGRCIACHSVSADGTTLVAQMDGGNGPGGAFNTGNGAATYWRGGMVQFQAVSPNGAWTMWGENPLYLSPTNSATLSNSFGSPQAGRIVANPGWSPLGNYIAYSSRINSGWYVDFYNADLGIIQVNPNTGAFANNHIIVPAPGGDRPIVTYPSFTPDDKFIVYQAANAIRTRGNYGNLWLTDVNGAAPTQLKAAEGIGQLDDGNLNISYEPTFSPTASGGYYWLVFVSNRDYGNTVVQAAPRKDNGVKQMWITAVDQNAQLGKDPSHPAFWLAGQQTNNNNMRGAFAKAPCNAANAACEWNDDCCGYNAQDPANSTAKCVISQPVSLPIKRTCTTFVPGQCKADGTACAVDTDCCGYPTSSCIQGLCKVPVFVQYQPGTFVRDFDPQCPAGTHVTWTYYQWKAYTPGDSNIVFDAQTADTVAGLNGAPKVSLLTAANQNGNWTFVDVGSKIGQSKNLLRVNATLNPSSDLTQAPMLTDWTMQYDCIPTF